MELLSVGQKSGSTDRSQQNYYTLGIFAQVFSYLICVEWKQTDQNVVH